MKTEADQIVEHLLRHKEYAKLVISDAYPFNAEDLNKYSDKLDWIFVSMNSNIIWTESLFKEFEKKIDIGCLGGCTSFPWTEEFIDKYIFELFYEIHEEVEVQKSSFAYNPGLPWSEEFIDKYAEHWDWGWLSRNESIPFTIELIDKYSDKWSYCSLENNIRIVEDDTLRSYLNIFYDCDVREYFHKCEYCFKGEEILEEYKGRGYSADFCNCPNFNWSTDFASKLKKRLISKEAEERVAWEIVWKPFDHWSIDVLDSFEEFWDYHILHYETKLNDYLAFGLRDSGRLEEVMKEL